MNSIGVMGRRAQAAAMDCRFRRDDRAKEASRSDDRLHYKFHRGDGAKGTGRSDGLWIP